MRKLKSLLTKKSKNYKLTYSAFNNGIATNIDDNLLPHKVAKMTYNFNIKDGKLKTGHGFKQLKLPFINCIGERDIVHNHTEIDGVWHYRDYDPEQSKDVDRIMFYSTTFKKIFWYQIESQDTYNYALFSEPFNEKPNAINYRINGEDAMLFSSPTDVLRVFKTGQTAQTVASGPKIISMCVHYERIFALTEGERISLAFSANLDPTSWDPQSDDAGFIDFVDERGKLEKVISFNDYVYVFREFGISRVTAYGNQNDFSVNHIYTSSSKIYGDSVAVCGNIVMFLANDGIYAFDGVTTKKIETGLEKYIYYRNKKAVGAFHNGKYYLACFLNFNDSLSIGHETNPSFLNNALFEIDTKSFEVSLTRGVDIGSMIALKYQNVSKLICSFNSGNKNFLGELTDDGKLFGNALPKVWTSPMSNLGFPNRIKHIKEIHLLSKYDCQIEIKTDSETILYTVVASDTTQRIKTDVKGELVQISFKSMLSDADISLPEIVVGVI